MVYGGIVLLKWKDDYLLSILEFIMNWISEHILQKDKQIVIS
jgi:hemerythrin